MMIQKRGQPGPVSLFYLYPEQLPRYLPPRPKRYQPLAESPFHGLKFCQGTVCEMLENPRVRRNPEQDDSRKSQQTKANERNRSLYVGRQLECPRTGDDCLGSINSPASTTSDGSRRAGVRGTPRPLILPPHLTRKFFRFR